MTAIRPLHLRVKVMKNEERENDGTATSIYYYKIFLYYFYCAVLRIHAEILFNVKCISTVLSKSSILSEKNPTCFGSVVPVPPLSLALYAFVPSELPMQLHHRHPSKDCNVVGSLASQEVTEGQSSTWHRASWKCKGPT